MRVIAADTETFLIGPENVAPKLVCLTYAFRDEDGELQTFLTGNGDDCIEDDLRDLFAPGHILVWHNAAYDLGVICESYPDLEPLVWQKLIAGEITDTKIRQKLLNLSTHGKLDMLYLPDGSSRKIGYSLANLVLDYLGLDISADKTGDDVWRMNYHTLDGLCAAQYPRDAAAYAMDDASLTLQVYECQEDRIETDDGHASCSTAPFHTAADFSLFCMTINGMAVDANEVELVEAWLEDELDGEALEPLYEAGILRRPEPARPHANQLKKALAALGLEEPPDSWEPHLDALADAGIKTTAPKAATLNRKELVARVEALCKEHGIELKLTDKGGTSTDSEVIDNIASLDPVMECYQHRQSLQKLVTTEIPRMKWEGETAPVVHFNYNVLLETGRTSSFAGKLFPSGNGQQIHPKIRPCYVPRKGNVLYSVDYSTLELVCVAQTTLDLFGYSVHADKINAGYDLHSYLGSGLATKLSPQFQEMLTAHGITDRDDGYHLFKTLNEDDKPFYKLWRNFSKPNGLGFPGGLGVLTMIVFAKKTYGIDYVQIAAERFEKFPHEFDTDLWAPKLWRYGQRSKKRGGLGYGWKAESDFEWTPMMKALALTSELRGIWLDTYPEMVDYFEWSMQTPAAEGAKAAVINLVRAARDPSQQSILYGTLPVNFVHDEVLGEIPEDDLMHERANEVRRILEDSMAVVIRDVKALGQGGGARVRRRRPPDSVGTEMTKPIPKKKPPAGRKVQDADGVVRQPRRSKWSDHIEGILALDPGQGWQIPVEPGADNDKFRRAVRKMVTRYVQPHSSFTYRCELTAQREVLVSCHG
ncbi:POLAc domain-containing protein [Durusdinium trenchii]|uniref:POLAc domain-containing protein n=1 Tax=Durusdinium trenchii TaxID=1381693 RepID=A0ABP0PHL3_9DINO